MRDDDEGYRGTDLDAKAMAGMGRAIAILLGLPALAMAHPEVRDWMWRTFRPADYAAAHRKAPDQAAIKADIDKMLVTMRRCDDGSVADRDEPCPDGSKGKLLMAQPAKR